MQARTTRAIGEPVSKLNSSPEPTPALRKDSDAKRPDAIRPESREGLGRLIDHSSDEAFCFRFDPPIPTDLPVDEQIPLLYQSVLVDCNGAFARSRGAGSPHELIGKGFRDLLLGPPGWLDGVFREFIKLGYRFRGAMLAPDPDGTGRTIRANAFGEVRDGSLYQIWGSDQDITELQRVVEENSFRQRFQRFLTQLTDQLFEMPSDRVVEGVRDSLERLGDLIDVDTVRLSSLDGADIQAVIASPGPTLNRPLRRTTDAEDPGGSHLAVHIQRSGNAIGRITVSTARELEWPDERVDQLRLVGKLLIAALEKSDIERDIEKRRVFDRFALALSYRFQGTELADLPAAVMAELVSVAEFLDVDAIFITAPEDSEAAFTIPCAWAKPDRLKTASEWSRGRFDASGPGWNQLVQGETLSRGVDGTERGFLVAAGARSYLEVGLPQVPYLCSIGVANAELTATWPKTTEPVMRIIGQIIGWTMRRVRTEGALRESQARFRALLEQSGDAFFRISPTGRILEANVQASRSLGYTTEGLLSKSLADIDTADQDHRYRTELWPELEKGQFVTFEAEQRRRDGSTFPVEVRLGTLDTRERVQLLALVRDITDRRRLEQQIVRSQDAFEDIFNAMSDGVVIHPEDSLEILEVNDRMCELLGVAKEEVLHAHPTDFYANPTATTRNDVDQMLQLVHEQGPQILHAEIRTTRGSSASIEVRLQRVMLSGVARIMAVVRDVTEFRRMQETLIQTEKMMTVGGLAAGMAHEINNPLSGILQGVQNTLRRIAPGTPANQRVAEELGIDLDQMNTYLQQRGVVDFLSGIQEAGTRAAGIVSNMLQFSRPGGSNPVPSDLNTIVERALSLSAAQFDPQLKSDFRHVQVDREVDLTLPLVPCISTEIEQVMMNLLDNAAHAMIRQENSTDPPRITVRTARDGRWARIEVEDRGVGMDEETRRRAFEPFFTTKGVGEGTGLGLSVSYFIITNNHGGTISAESEIGRGTKFIIRLPLG